MRTIKDGCVYEKMKILHVIHGYTPAIGGAEFLVQQLSEYLANNTNDEVTVYTTFGYNTEFFSNSELPSISSDRSNEVINGVGVRRFKVINRFGKKLNLLQSIFYRYRLWGNGFLRMFYYGPISPSMKKAIRNYSGDLIVGSSFPLYHMNYLFNNKRRLPVILIGCYHTTDNHGFDNTKIMDLIRKASGYAALTVHEKQFLVNKGIEADKIEVIGVGLPIRKDSEGEDRVGSIDPSDVKSRQAPVILFVGQHGRHKGIDILMQSMPGVWMRHPDAVLQIVGAKTCYTPVLKNLAVHLENGTPKRIRFMDNVSEQDKENAIKHCDIFVTPSRYESFGITILEAWKHKKPVIACNLEATKCLISDRDTGILVEYNDIKQLTAAIISLLEEPGKRLLFGENGHKKYLENFTIDTVGRKYREFCIDVIKRNNRIAVKRHEVEA